MSSNVKFVYDLEVTRKGQSRSTVKMHFINCVMVNICVYMHLGHRSNRQNDTGHFHFRDLKMTHKGQSRSKIKMTFINWAMLNIFVLRHPGPMSNGLDDTGHFHFCDLEMKRSIFCGF